MNVQSLETLLRDRCPKIIRRGQLLFFFFSGNRQGIHLFPRPFGQKGRVNKGWACLSEITNWPRNWGNFTRSLTRCIGGQSRSTLHILPTPVSTERPSLKIIKARDEKQNEAKIVIVL